MAIITEEQEPDSPKRQNISEPPKPTSSSSQNPKPQTENPFAFWFYFTVTVSLITLLFSFHSFLSPEDPKSWFLSLPGSLRQHYSNGRIIKVQTGPNQSPIEVFFVEHGASVAENVVIVHGLGLSSYSYRDMIRSLGSKGVRVVAIDLPGNGFSDKSKVEIVEGEVGVLGRLRQAYDLIQEKGVFWAFDQMVETGRAPYEEIESQLLKRKSVKVIELSSEEMGKVLGQVIEALGLASVHLVLHDSALNMGASWILDNSRSVRSVTLIDTGLRSALPLWALDIPVIREVILGFSFAYSRLIGMCCTKEIGSSELEAHRVLLKGRGGRKAVVGMGKRLNYSFDVAEWGALDGIKDMPMQLLWSSHWSNEWTEEGRRVAEALPQAKFIAHSSGRWPQGNATDELAETIAQFISSLPKSVRQVEEEPIPEHIQKMLDEAKATDHHHDHHDHHHPGNGGHGHHGSHAHPQAGGYMDAYGLGHGWGS
ncbi:hypothetical protein SLE2022_126420 [Rubroshorea leprosula]